MLQLAQYWNSSELKMYLPKIGREYVGWVVICLRLFQSTLQAITILARQKRS